jgi:hypothetical protein
MLNFKLKQLTPFLLLFLLVSGEAIEISKRIKSESSQRTFLGGKTSRKSFMQKSSNQNKLKMKATTVEYQAFDQKLSISMGKLVGCDSGDQGDCLDSKCTQDNIAKGALTDESLEKRDVNLDDLQLTIVKNLKKKVHQELLQKMKEKTDKFEKDFAEGQDAAMQLAASFVEESEMTKVDSGLVFCTIAAATGLVGTTISLGEMILAKIGGVSTQQARDTAAALSTLKAQLEAVKQQLNQLPSGFDTGQQVKEALGHVYNSVSRAEQQLLKMKKAEFLSRPTSRNAAEKTCMHPGMMWTLGILTVGIYSGITYGIVKSHDNHYADQYLNVATPLMAIDKGISNAMQILIFAKAEYNHQEQMKASK